MLISLFLQLTDIMLEICLDIWYIIDIELIYILSRLMRKASERSGGAYSEKEQRVCYYYIGSSGMCSGGGG